MRRKLTYSQLPAVVALFLGVSLLACAGMTARRVVYTTIDDATTAVQAAMTAFNELYQPAVVIPRLGRPLGKADREVALAAYAKFQRVAERATLILKGSLAAPGEDPIALASAAATEAISAIGGLH